MASFVVLGNYTDQGVGDIKDLPTRLGAIQQSLQDAGGRMIFYYLTMGAYDFVSVVELPDAETASRWLLQRNMEGGARTQTMRAFTEQEAAALVGGLQ